MKMTDDKTKPTKDIYLAGGCFWGTEHYFKQIEGVARTEVGFANGHTENPTYKEVYTDTTGFAETVFVRFYPDVVSLEFLLRCHREGLCRRAKELRAAFSRRKIASTEFLYGRRISSGLS